MKEKTIHFRSIRLFVNAGMNFPVCYSQAKLLDLDKTRLTISGNKKDVTCKNCLRIINKK